MASFSAPDSTNPSLLARLRLADETAWQTLIDLYGPLVLSWCRRAGLGDSDSDDVGQETFLAVRRGLPGFRKERPGDTFRGWLRTVTRSKVADHEHLATREGRRSFRFERLAALVASGLPDHRSGYMSSDGLRATRKPKLLFRIDGTNPPRYADRQPQAELSQLPPR